MTSPTETNRRVCRPVPFVFLVALFSLLGCAETPEPSPGNDLLLEISGQVDVNGTTVNTAAVGTYDRLTGGYEFSDDALTEAPLNRRDKLLLSMIPRSALAFTARGDRVSLLDQGQGELIVDLEARRKVDETSSIKAEIQLQKSGDRLEVRYNGTITTPMDGGRPIEPDGEAVIRLGINPRNGTFVGGARINYDVSQPDPAGLGTADFWNLQGDFEDARAPANAAYAHVDHAAGDPDAGIAKGVIFNFEASTVFEPGIITLSGVANKDGLIHQYLGIANQTGGGHTILTFPVQIKKGMTGVDVASLIAEGFMTAREGNDEGMVRHILAVQGGDGIGETTPDPESGRVAVTMTVDGASIAQPNDPSAIALLDEAATQAFSDQQVLGSENTGIRNQFGVLGEPPLTGWLTPFKVVFSTDNPETGNQAAGGNVAILLNWTDNIKGRRGLDGSQTDFGDLVIPTQRGESAEAIVERLTKRLKEQRTQWGTYAFTQRDGNVLYVDAGLDFPHSVSLASEDAGVGYMSAAADLPFFRREGK